MPREEEAAKEPTAELEEMRRRIAGLEASLEQSERRYRLLFHQLSEALAVHQVLFDADGKPRDYRFQDVNPAFERMTGLKREDILGKRMSEVLPGLEPNWLDLCGQVALTGCSLKFDSHSRDLARHYQVIAFRPQEGQLATLFLDMTHHEEVEAEREQLLSRLQESNDRLRATTAEAQQRALEAQHRAAELDATISSIADGIAIFNSQGEIVRLNPTAMDFLGIRPDQPRPPVVRWTAMLRAQTPEGKPFPLRQLPPVRALRGETVQGVVMILRSPAGRTTWVSTSAAPIIDTDGKLLGAAATFTDITALHNLQEQRAQYILGISHGLRTPLTVVQGQAQLLLRALMDDAGANGRMLWSANAIAAAAQRMSVTIRDLVDLTHLEAGQELRLNRLEVEPSSFVRDLLHRMSNHLETHRVQVEAAEGIPPAAADPDRLERILVNLLSNALRYSEPDTKVTVALFERNDEVVFSVQDRGAGIDPEELPHLFEPYRRMRLTRERQESLGLGLYITRGLVKAHGGHIWVESQVGQGSNFTFTIPAAPGHGSEARREQAG